MSDDAFVSARRVAVIAAFMTVAGVAADLEGLWDAPWDGDQPHARVTEEPQPRRAAPAPRERKVEPWPDVRRPPPVTTVDWERERRMGQGTAFPIGDAGLWLTARHVVDDCDGLRLPSARQDDAALDWFRAPIAKIAVLDSEADVAALAGPRAGFGHVAATQEPAIGARAVAAGYPTGVLGFVDLRKLSVRHYSGRGGFHREDDANVWVIDDYAPRDLTRLGGASGGPIFDADGEVVGVLIGSAFRRGRVVSTSVSAIQRSLAQAGDSSGGAAQPLPDALNLDFARSRSSPILCYVKPA